METMLILVKAHRLDCIINKLIKINFPFFL